MRTRSKNPFSEGGRTLTGDLELADLGSLHETAPVGFCVIDRDLRFVHINERLAEINGLPVSEHLGRTLRDVIPDMAPSVEPHYRRVIDTGEPIIGIEVRGRTRARPSEDLQCLMSYYPVRGSDGSVRSVSTVVQDMTRERAVERTLVDSEIRYRTLVEYAAEAICVLDIETGRFVDFNENALRLFGLDRGALLSAGPAELSPPLQPDGRPSGEKAKELLAEAHHDGPVSFEWVHRHSDGRDIHCEIRLVNYPMHGRKLVRGSITDITERKHAEQVRRKSEERTRLLLETTNAIPWESDPKTWRFLYVGPQAVEILGYPLAQWLEPEFWQSHIHPEDRDSAIAFCQTSTERCEDHTFEYRMITSTGQVVWMHDLVTVESKDGIPVLLRGIMIDITERKRAELLQSGQKRVLERLARGEPLVAVLGELARTVDAQQTGMLCSILLLDGDGKHLRHGVAPSLPEEYNDAIDGMAIGPNEGSCGSAAYRNERIIASDIATDPLWKDFRDLALRFNLQACWSQPILSESGDVLGTLAIYHEHPTQPSDAELELIEQAAYIAGIAIDRTRANEALRTNEAELRRSHAELQELAGRLLSAQEEERRRLARDLHDDLTQRLAALAIEAGKLQESSSSVPKPVRNGLGMIKKQAVELSKEVQDMSHQLHPSILDDLGLVDAVASECARFSEREGIQVEFVHQEVPRSLPRSTAVCLYRVVQESLHNVAKHSRAKRARVSVTGSDGELVLAVSDNGIGFDGKRTTGRRGLGLASMEERVRLIGATLTVQSTKRAGTTIEVRLATPAAPDGVEDGRT